MTWWKALIAAALALGVLGITAGGLKKRPPPAIEAQLAKSRKSTVTRTITGAGKVNAVTTVKISSNLSGDLVELGIREGDPVKKGQVLGRIDRRKFEASAKQALAAQSAARSDMRAAQV